MSKNTENPFQSFVQQYLNELKEELATYNFSLEVSREGVIALGDFYTQAYQSGTFPTDYFVKFSMHLGLFIGEFSPETQQKTPAPPDSA